jgi:SAM-dependent methyltransferase
MGQTFLPAIRDSSAPAVRPATNRPIMVYSPFEKPCRIQQISTHNPRIPMPVVKLAIPVPIPGFLYPSLQKIRRLFSRSPVKPASAPSRESNLEGDRDIEWTWVSAHMPAGPGRALDFGTGESNLAFQASLQGFEVTSIDLVSHGRFYSHPKVRYLQADLLTMNLPAGSLDLIINCSTVEHVGLSGRYGVTDPLPDGDLSAMNLMLRALKPGGTMLLTIPVGLDQVFAPLCRTYGRKRLPRLLKGYSTLKEEFWWKKNSNVWTPCSREEALNFQACAGSWNYLENIYALGCFVLRRPTVKKSTRKPAKK